MSRLTIDISEQQHQSLKALAALQGKTIKQYAIERLFPGNVDNDPAWQELKGVLTARINDAWRARFQTGALVTSSTKNCPGKIGFERCLRSYA